MLIFINIRYNINRFLVPIYKKNRIQLLLPIIFKYSTGFFFNPEIALYTVFRKTYFLSLFRNIFIVLIVYIFLVNFV